MTASEFPCSLRMKPNLTSERDMSFDPLLSIIGLSATCRVVLDFEALEDDPLGELDDSFIILILSAVVVVFDRCVPVFALTYSRES